jgi:hypothetical protein
MINKKDAYGLMVTIIIALPATWFAIVGRFSSITYTGTSFFYGKVILLSLFIIGVGAAIYLLRTTVGVMRSIQLVVFIVHFMAFSTLVYWFARG